jgi:prepilin-type N-terminal cleavage/methylation domain-containing protein
MDYLRTLSVPSRGSRDAVTLIELLVVIAIITLLITLFFPAVQASRDSANRTKCANQLRQIGLAFQLHHDALGAFPTRGRKVDAPRSLTPDGAIARVSEQTWGWAYQILPYLEQTALWENPDDAAVKAATLETYFCPSRRKPVVFEVNHSRSVGPRGQIDYAGSTGTEPDGLNGLLVPCHYKTQGEWVKPNAVRLPGSVPDGASNTLLVSERYLDPRWRDFPRGPEDNDFRGGYIAGNLVRSGNFQPVRDRPYEHLNDYARFGSAHPVSFNAVFGDGAVHTVRYAVSIKVFKAACGRDDGDALDLSHL